MKKMLLPAGLSVAAIVLAGCLAPLEPGSPDPDKPVNLGNNAALTAQYGDELLGFAQGKGNRDVTVTIDVTNLPEENLSTFSILASCSKAVSLDLTFVPVNPKVKGEDSGGTTALCGDPDETPISFYENKEWQADELMLTIHPQGKPKNVTENRDLEPAPDDTEWRIAAIVGNPDDFTANAGD